jgi:hypothetical protein
VSKGRYIDEDPNQECSHKIGGLVMKLSKILYSLLPLVALVISSLACNFPGSAPIKPEDAVQATINAVETQRALLEGEEEPSPEPVGEDLTPTPTIEEPSPTPTPTFTPLPTATEIPCDRATFVTDVTVPDGADYSPGDVFTKTWRLKNTGSCTWTSGYDLVFDHGDQMGAPAAVQLTSGTVGPNQTLDVSVQLTAPGSEGGYKGYFKLRNPQGAIFGIGATGSIAFWVEIEVLGPPEPNFTVSFVNIGLCNPIYATFKVKNTGDYTFEWARITIQDLTASTTLYGPGTNSVPFLASSSDCPPGLSAMDPGQTRYIAASIGSPVPNGHNARLTLKLCTQDGGGGQCVEKSTDFTVP